MRGQAHTLEALTAAFLLLSAITFALQVTAVTPLTGSTSSQHIENQQASVAEGILASEAENGTVLPTLLYWDGTNNTFWGTTQRGYASGGPPTTFGNVTESAFLDRGIAYNVNVYYIRDGERVRIQLVHLGTPSDHASVARRSFTLTDDHRLRDANMNETDTLGNESTQYFAPDVEPAGPLYNVLEVEVVVWRM